MSVAAILLFSGCIRSAADVSAPSEGISFTGRVVTRDPQSGSLVGVRGSVAELLNTSFRTVTDESGVFRFDGLPIGTFDLLATSTGAETRRRLVAGIDLLTDGQIFTSPDIELGESRTLRGRVTVGTSTSSPGVGVRVWIVGTNFFTFTDAEGAYRIAGVPDPWRAGGEYELAFYLDGYRPERLVVDGSPDAVDRIPPVDLEIDEQGLSVEVFGSVSLVGPGPASPITATFTNLTRVTARPTAPVSDGAFRVRLPPGAYRARFEAAGFVPAEVAGIIVLPMSGPLELRPVFLAPVGDGDQDRDGVPDDEDDDRDNDGVTNDRDVDPDDPTRTVESTACDVPPVLVSISPSSVRAATPVTVLARPITPPDCAPPGAEPARLVFSATPEGTVAAGPTPGTIVAMGSDGLEQAEYIVPPSADPGPVVLRASYVAQPSEAFSLNVLPASMEVTQAVPAAGPPGTLLAIEGRGFFGLPDDTELQVRIANQTAEIFATPKESLIQVTVPRGLADGPVTGVVTNGSRSATFEFLVSDTAPIIDLIRLELLEPGIDNLEIEGQNLDLVNIVEFGNGVIVAPTFQLPRLLVVEPIPVDAGGGPIILTSPGQPEIRSQEALTMIVEAQQISSVGDVAISIDPVGGPDELLEFTRGQIQRYDYATFQPTGAPETFSASNDTLYGVAPRPAHDRAVVIAAPGTGGANGPQILVLRLSDLQIVGSCPIAVTPPGVIERGEFRATFSADQRHAYIYEPSASSPPTLIRVDMESPNAVDSACDELTLDGVCTPNFVGQIAGIDNERVYAVLESPTTGIAQMEINEDEPPQLECAEPATNTVTLGLNAQFAYWDQRDFVWVRSNETLTALSPFPTDALIQASIAGNTTAPRYLARIADSNWLTTGTEVFSRETLRLLWRSDLDARRLPDTHPSRFEFVLPTTAPPLVRKFRILADTLP